VNFIVKWAFRKAQWWLLYFLPYWILASLNVIKSGPKIKRAGIAELLIVMLRKTLIGKRLKALKSSG
jgi:hypothetical protein